MAKCTKHDFSTEHVELLVTLVDAHLESIRYASDLDAVGNAWTVRKILGAMLPGTEAKPKRARRQSTLALAVTPVEPVADRDTFPTDSTLFFEEELL
jgi:hypothetical protein